MRSSLGYFLLSLVPKVAQQLFASGPFGDLPWSGVHPATLPPQLLLDDARKRRNEAEQKAEHEGTEMPPRFDEFGSQISGAVERRPRRGKGDG